MSKPLFAIKFILVCLLLSTTGWAQIGVTGNLKDLGANNATSSQTYVGFTLRNYGSRIPTVTGTNVIVSPNSPPFNPNASGVISGNIQPNDTIAPAGTYYQVCIYYQGQSQWCQNYVINSTPNPWNLNTATPLASATPATALLAGPQSFFFSQSSAATTWTITHNLNTLNVFVQCWDTSNILLAPSSITKTSVNIVTVTFGLAQAGTCLVDAPGNPYLLTGAVGMVLLNPTQTQTIAGAGLTLAPTVPFTTNGPGTHSGTEVFAATTAFRIAPITNSAAAFEAANGGSTGNIYTEGGFPSINLFQPSAPSVGKRWQIGVSTGGVLEFNYFTGGEGAPWTSVQTALEIVAASLLDTSLALRVESGNPLSFNVAANPAGNQLIQWGPAGVAGGLQGTFLAANGSNFPPFFFANRNANGSPTTATFYTPILFSKAATDAQVNAGTVPSTFAQLNADNLTATRQLGFPDASGNFVLDTAAQTLSAKTLVTPTVSNGTQMAALSVNANSQQTTSGNVTLASGGPPITTTLSSNQGVSAGVLTTIISVSPTVPSSGGPFRVWLFYGAHVAMGGTAATCDTLVTDGTNNFATVQGTYTTNAVGGQSGSAISTVTYANGATPTFTLKIQCAQAATVSAAANQVGQNTWLTAQVVASN